MDCLTSSLFFYDRLSTIHTLNSFRLLDMDAPCPTTSPSLKQNMYKSPTEPKKLKLLNINFQSIVNKFPDFHCLVDTEKSDIIGTESWLTAEINDNEVFPQSYIPF